MPEPLKNLYNTSFFENFCEIMDDAVPGFDKAGFMNRIYEPGWEEKELKQRMKHIAVSLRGHLPDSYPGALEVILNMIHLLKQSELADKSLEFMFIPEFMEMYGLEDYDESVKAMEKITPFTSCEFAVRPFIVKYSERMMRQMVEWSQHDNHHVRRLASEGCRPRLPWAMALTDFKKDPAPVLPVLENLKEDPSEYVRRSVANNLNDIAKDHPETVLEICRRWQGYSQETDRLVKHGCRTLLKQAHPGALQLFGYAPHDTIKILELRVDREISIGGRIFFSFRLKNSGNAKVKVRLEYGIDYRKANGSQNRKIFKITETHFDAGEEVTIKRSQSFQDMTTRKHYAGGHRLAVIVNGIEMSRATFELIK